MQIVLGRMAAAGTIVLAAVLATAAQEKATPNNSSGVAQKANDGKKSTKEASSSEEAGDEEVKPEALSKEIKSAIQKRFPKSKIVSAEKGTEDDKLIFEVRIKSEQHNIDVTLTPDGKILSFERALPSSERPETVMRSLSAKYPHATVKLVEEVWEKDKLTGYEATIVTTGKKTLEVSFDTKGKLIENEK